ncbi:hypothetical protein GO986_11590 [Deinococcus sp. HMF7620]|uniref:Uncharacterized protein n=1 Tax=Deinococcus arboris TaxID=2682977 RepID=A0A7C9HYR1_9DEIO|nr:hypothetical protein [Deinococcus arboris]MVN87410.1 hypothetical protein [Deinococcus arboris]
MTFSTFKQLLSQPGTSAEFIGLVEHLLNLRPEADLRFVDAAGHAVELEEVHYRIQGQAAWQATLYNRAMNHIR